MSFQTRTLLLSQGSLQLVVRHFLLSVVLLHGLLAMSQTLEIRKTIKEELLPGFVVANLATEPDFISMVNDAINSRAISRNSSNLHYSVLTMGNPNSRFFGVDPASGIVTIKRNIDREQVCSFRDECLIGFQIAARSVYGVFFRLVDFKITVTDINDNPPEFTQWKFELNIPENAESGRTFQLPSAFDRDTGAGNRVSEYKILAGPPIFGLKKLDSGVNSSEIFLSLENVITRESELPYKVLVGAIDGGTPPLTGTLTVEIHVFDINDNFPIFEKPEYVGNVSEAAGIDQAIVQVKATDSDTGLNGEINYSFSAQQPQDDLDFFRIDAKTGEIFLTKSVESRTGDSLFLVVEAKDQGHPPRMSTVLVQIHVEDTVNSVPNVMVDTLGGPTEGIAEVSEYAEIGKVVAFVSVQDPDSGDNGHTICQLKSQEFELFQLGIQGIYNVKVITKLDREARDLYNLTLSCFDNGFPSLTAVARFAVKILDENDQKPIFSMRIYETTLNENNAVGALITQLSVTDGDIGKNAEILYDVTGTGRPYIDVDETGKVTAKASFDRETSQKIIAMVTATDRGSPPLSSSATVIINLLDVNDMRPEFSQETYIFEVEEEQPLSEFVGVIAASDKDSGTNRELSYFFQNPQTSDIFNLGSDDGILTTNAVLDRERKDFHSFNVIAVDKGVPSLTGTATVIVNLVDINDNDPYFIFPVPENNTIVIPHTVEPHSRIASAQAHDFDSGLNSRIIYSASTLNSSASFSIYPLTGILFIEHRLSKSDVGAYILTLVANDQGPKQQRATQTLLYVEVYFDNSTLISVVGTAGFPKETITIFVVAGVVLLIAVVIVITVVCIQKRRAKRKQNRGVPNSASTSSTAKLHGGYYVAPGVRDSSSFFLTKQNDGACNSNMVQELPDRAHAPYFVLHPQPRSEAEAAAEIVKISLNGNQNGFTDTLNPTAIKRTDSDQFSTFRSQEDILIPGQRHGSLRRQDHESSSVCKRANDTFDDLSCDESTSDSGRGGSDVDVNNGAALAKQDKGRAQAATPVSVKSGISDRLSPPPQQEKTFITFHGHSPHGSLTRNIPRSRVSSMPVISAESKRYPLGSSTAFSGPESYLSETDVESEHGMEHSVPFRPLNFAEVYSHEASAAVGGYTSDQDGDISRNSHRLLPSVLSTHSTYPRHFGEGHRRDLVSNPSNSLPRRDYTFKPPAYLGGEFTHHAYGAVNRNNDIFRKSNPNNGRINQDYEMSEAESDNTLGDQHSNDDLDYRNIHNPKIANDGHHYSFRSQNLVPEVAVTANYSDAAESQIHETHPESIEEDFLLPPYPEVNNDEEEEDCLNIRPGYTSPAQDSEISALVTKSRFESSA